MGEAIKEAIDAGVVTRKVLPSTYPPTHPFYLDPQQLIRTASFSSTFP